MYLCNFEEKTALVWLSVIFLALVLVEFHRHFSRFIQMMIDITAYCMLSKRDTKTKPMSLIPGPFSLPFLGTKWSFALGSYSTEKIPEYYRDMHEQYGPIFKEEEVGNIPIIHVCEKEDIETVFKSAGKYPARPPSGAIAKYRSEHPERYASTGLVNEQGERWLFLRQNLTKALTSPATIQEFMPQVEAIADDWCHLVTQKGDADGSIFNVEELAEKLALEVTCALVLGRRMGFLLEDDETVQSDTAKKLAEAVHQNFIACRDTYFGLPLWIVFPTPAYKRLTASESAIYKLASELIKTAEDASLESTVFQSVIKANIDEREKKSALVDFLAAGIYTLRNSLLFVLYQVALNPECQQHILKENKEQYIKACLNETYRLFPTVMSLARITDRDVVLSGYHVKAGTVVVCQTALACKNDKYFREAWKYKPERWFDEEKDETNTNAAYLVNPFGYGKRICPGKRFIEHTLPILLEKIVQKFDITVLKAMEINFEFLLAPKGNVWMNFKDRGVQQNEEKEEEIQTKAEKV